MSTYLGALTVQVFHGEDGMMFVNHQTELAPALDAMQPAMSAAEKHRAVELRRVACARAAEFFAFIANPDRPREVLQ